MTSKSDWEAAERERIAADRQRLGEPPTAEEVLAYFNDQLSEEDAARVQDLLIAYPELARIMTATVDEQRELPQPELDRQWRRLRDRMQRPVRIAAMTRKQRGQSVFAMAASVVICVLGVWLVQSKMNERELHLKLREPRIAFETTTLRTAEHRGPSEGAAILSAKSEGHLLKAPMIDPPQFPEYRLDLVAYEGRTRRVLWSRSGLGRPAADTFEVLIPRGFLRPGTYRLEVHGVRDAKSERIASYNVSIIP